MACPVHIWVPLMAAAAPAARVVRTRLRLSLDARRARSEETRTPAEREVKRWAPVGSTTTDEARHSS
jgi:hypothetical protein